MATHKVQFRVYYEDTDAGGIVYHARYLAFAERARSEAMRAANAAVTELLETDGIGFVVRQVNVRYRTPLRLEDMMEVETALVAMTPARLKLKQTIRNAERLEEEAVILDVELACIEMNTLRPARIPPHWCVAIRKLEAGEH